jgi:hypothetical protein
LTKIELTIQIILLKIPKVIYIVVPNIRFISQNHST